MSTSSPRLDDLYKMVAYIYGDKLSSRSSEATFSHLVEVCGMLTIHARDKKREGIDVTDALCKALGWYFPLVAKFKVASIEALVFRKFPWVCPYCREAPHDEAKCKQVKGTLATVNHEDLATIARSNWTSRPKTLNEWQAMFQKIYPRQLTDARGARSVVGLFEELGELAEAVRVGDAHPRYFFGEAADTFSYIMAVANEHALKLALDSEHTFSFQDEFLKRYPGLCTQCGHKVCACPSIPEATIGRMAKEINFAAEERPFINDLQRFGDDGKNIAREVLELQGGYNGLTAQLPFDRGDANHSLVLLCNGIADALETESPELAATLRAGAFKVGSSARPAGTPRKPLDITSLLQNVMRGWAKLSKDQRKGLKAAEGDLIGDLGTILDTRRVLFVHSNPEYTTLLRLDAELRTIKQTIGSGKQNIVVENLPAATVDYLRSHLLHSAPYEIVHFSGHADADNLVFDDGNGNTHAVSLDAISELLGRQEIKCVILNACQTARNMRKAIAPFTIGMDKDIEDKVAKRLLKGLLRCSRRWKNA